MELVFLFAVMEQPRDHKIMAGLEAVVLPPPSPAVPPRELDAMLELEQDQKLLYKDDHTKALEEKAMKAKQRQQRQQRRRQKPINNPPVRTAKRATVSHSLCILVAHCAILLMISSSSAYLGAPSGR
jgi:hypothetical protein